MKKLAFVLVLLAPVMAYALDIPKAGADDYRVKDVNYNPNNVTKIVAHFGYGVDIIFAEDEYVLKKGIFGGDTNAWTIGTLKNHLIFKPKELGGKTNFKVITNLRYYNFDLSSHESRKGAESNDMMYQVNFHYPTEEAAKLAAAKAAANTKVRLDVKTEPKNWNYSVQGSEDVAPDAASDDGTFTSLTFSGNREIPAIFIVNADGSESLVNRHVEGKTVKVQSLARKFVLRKGNAVACVFNDSYDPVGLENSTGTTVPNVERIIKGGNP